MSDKLQRLEGVSVCLAHASLVTGDSGMCERVDGDLPPELGDDELECGPFSDEVYYVFDWKPPEYDAEFGEPLVDPSRERLGDT